MKRLKIFLASSVNEFKNERNQIGNTIRKLQDKLIDNGVRINLFECEFADNTVSTERKQADYNSEIPTSDIFIMIVGKRIGQYTLEEYEIAKKSKVKHIQVIFKDVEYDEDVKKIRQDESINKYEYKSREELDEIIKKLILDALNEN